MNFLPLILVAFILISGSKGSQGGPFSLNGLFGSANGQNSKNNTAGGFDFAKIAPLLANPNALAALESVNKLMDKNNNQDKTSVIFELLANPFVGELLAILSSGNNSNHNNNESPQMNNNFTNADSNTSNNGFYNTDVRFNAENDRTRNDGNNTENKNDTDKVSDMTDSNDNSFAGNPNDNSTANKSANTYGNDNSVNTNASNASEYNPHEEKSQYDSIIDEIRSRILDNLG